MPLAGRKSQIPWSLAGAVVFFILLWLLDFPKPMIDDLFYSGAALNMASGGDFSNPLLAGQQFPSHYFFVYTPVHSYALAGWLIVFGISAAAMTAFQITLYLVTTISTVAILRRHAAPAWLDWVVPLGVSAAFLRGGLRMEPLAVALTMTGFAGFEMGANRGVGMYLSFLLMFLGAAVSPRLALFSGALIACASWRSWRDGATTTRPRWGNGLLLLAALLTTGFLFLAMIHFRFGEFLTTFRFHAAGAREREGKGVVQFLLFFSRALGVTVWPLLFLMPVFVLLRLRQPRDDLAVTAWVLLLVLPAALGLGFLGFGAGWYIFLILLLLTPGIVAQGQSAGGKVAAMALWLALLVGNSRALLDVSGVLAGELRESETGQREAALALRSTPEHPLVVDVWAARYAYDYHLPLGALNFEFAAPFPRKLVLDAEFPSGDIFVIGPDGMEEVWKHGGAFERPPKWLPLGRERWSFYRFPRKVSIVRAIDCQRTP